MATLEKIRSKFGVIAAGVIGLALISFILSDLFDSRSSWFQGSRNKLGEVAGNSITYPEFEQKVNDIIEVYKINGGQDVDEALTENIREQAWEQLVNDKLMTGEYEKLGLDVSSNELYSLVQGADPHPIVKQIFTNPETGQFMRENMLQFLKNMDKDPSGKQLTFWLYFENQIRSQQLATKYINLIRKGISAPTFIAKEDYNDNNKKVNFNFIVDRLASVSDSAITYTNSDVKNYYSEHKYLYEQNSARDIEYVTFNVVPSESDKTAALEYIEKLKPELKEASEVEQFVNNTSDVTYNDKNYSKRELSDSLGAFMFNAEPGAVYGPYLENNSYKIARLYKIVNIPDSVKARHILIRPSGQTEADYNKAKSEADSLKNLIEKGANFAELAKTYSADKSNADKGGDLGWFKEGLMVKAFSDAAFETPKGKTVIVESNYGIHILQVMERGKEVKKVKVAVVERKIEASSQTYSKIYNDAVRFSENNTYEKFNSAVTSKALSKQFASIGEGDRTVMGLENPRLLIRWVYNAKEKEVSEPIDLGKQYVVASLVTIKKKGIAPLNIVKTEVNLAVRKQKKAELIAEKVKKAMNGVNSLEALASNLKLNIETASDVSFSSYSLPSVGFEPVVISEAANMPQNKLSGTIEGANGIYVIMVTNIVEPTPIKDYTATLTRINASFDSRATYDGINALRKLANIKDNRINFY